MNPTDTQPALCAKGCGFFATSGNKNLCSKCFNDYIKGNIQKHLDALVEPETEKSPASAEETAGKPATPATATARAKVRRCKACNRKIGLLGFECRCGNVFCGLHRYPEEHSCPSDYKESSRLELAKKNPLITSDKLERF